MDLVYGMRGGECDASRSRLDLNWFRSFDKITFSTIVRWIYVIPTHLFGLTSWTVLEIFNSDCIAIVLRIEQIRNFLVIFFSLLVYTRYILSR